ncbi:PA14 domain [Mycobacteroides abscessus]|nr:PA14 domain [Mycobacteroides abscessus]
MPTIDWSTAEQFGAEDNFISQVSANLHVPADGQYQFRVTNDDGALVYIDGQLVLENDGPNDSTSVEGSDKQRLTLRDAHRGRARPAGRLLRGQRQAAPHARVEDAGQLLLPGDPDLGAQHRGRRRARDGPRLQVLRGRDRHSGRRAAARLRQPELRARRPAPRGLRAQGLRPGVHAGRAARRRDDGRGQLRRLAPRPGVR